MKWAAKTLKLISLPSLEGFKRLYMYVYSCHLKKI